MHAFSGSTMGRLRGTVLLACALCGGVQAAERAPAPQGSAAYLSYPDRPIRFIVPYPPGGGTDIVARLIAQRLAEALGQQVVIDNRGGANAIIGTGIAAKAAPDGYTMLFALPASVAVNPNLYHDLPYEPLRDFAPVIQLLSFPLLLAAHPGVPASNVRELIALAQAKPGQLNFASSGNGSAPHLAMEMFKSMAKVQMVHVPYKGGGPAMNDLLAGQVQIMAGTMISELPFVKAGRLKGLAVTTAKRAVVLPDVPTVSESLPGYEISNWHGILVPRATAPAIVMRLNRETLKILQTQEARERFASQGAEPAGGTPAAFDALIKAELVRYRQVLRDAGVQTEASRGIR